MRLLLLLLLCGLARARTCALTYKWAPILVQGRTLQLAGPAGQYGEYESLTLLAEGAPRSFRLLISALGGTRWLAGIDGPVIHWTNDSALSPAFSLRPRGRVHFAGGWLTMGWKKRQQGVEWLTYSAAPGGAGFRLHCFP